jgi:anti-anti-sigma regulatory factor
LSQLVRALSLLGVKALLTGILPDMAKTFIAAGIEIQDVGIYRDLRQAIAKCRA